MFLKASSQNLFFVGAFIISLFPSLAQANTRIWEQNNNPANYVVLEGIKEADAENMVLNHPYHFDPKKFTDMLLSVRYNKSMLIRKDMKDQQVFFDAETVEKKFVPHIIEAFDKARPDQVVVFSIVQKDPFFIIRNDRLNVVRAYVAQDGLHLAFIKTNAALIGDYQAHTTGQKMIQSAKGLHVSLEPQEGQKLSYQGTNEIVLDMNYDFATLVDKKAAEEEAAEELKKKRKKRGSTDAESQAQAAPSQAAPTNLRKQETLNKPVPAPIATPTPASTAPSGSTADRLKQLKSLKDQGLITPQEYEAKKKEILKDL